MLTLQNPVRHDRNQSFELTVLECILIVPRYFVKYGISEYHKDMPQYANYVKYISNKSLKDYQSVPNNDDMRKVPFIWVLAWSDEIPKC